MKDKSNRRLVKTNHILNGTWNPLLSAFYGVIKNVKLFGASGQTCGIKTLTLPGYAWS